MANIQYKVSDDATQYLAPAGGNGIIDIVHEFPWTLTPKSGREKVPSIQFTEFQQTAGQLVASLVYIYRLGLAGKATTLTGNLTPQELYANKYFAKPTGWTYVMPYFNPRKYYRQTGFSDENSENPFSSVYKLGQSAIEGFTTKHTRIKSGFQFFTEASAIFNTAVDIIDRVIPGKLNLDLPRFWTGTSEGSYDITFDLFNTGSLQDIINNRNFCEIITRNNTQSRRNAMITDPVCIYEITCPDVIHMPAACITNLEITNLGNTRLVDGVFNGGAKVVPEAYRIKITFNSLLQPSRQIMDSLDKGEPVKAIADDKQLEADLKNVIPQLTKAFSSPTSQTSTPANK